MRRTADVRLYVIVSIHARQFHSGRPARPAGARSPRRCFNPRPPISQRATRDGRGAPRARQPVSIHARQFHSGRPKVTLWSGTLKPFQSTPANFTAGDDCNTCEYVADAEFQSTPANFTAGDILTTVVRTESFSFQSTPANFTAGDRQSSGGCGPVRGFNPRPPISQRATASITRSTYMTQPGFNPRPPISQRATAERQLEGAQP